MYQVTVFAIRGERGIVNSSVEYMELLNVEVVPTTTSIINTTSVVNATDLKLIGKYDILSIYVINKGDGLYI